MAKNLLPFWVYPSHWGLRGNSRKLAEIDFYYDGIEAELKRVDILSLTKIECERAKNELHFKYGLIDEFDFEVKKIDIDFDNAIISKQTHTNTILDLKLKYFKIEERDYDSEKIELIKDEDSKYLAALKFSLKYEMITEHEYEKELATYKKEPWFLFDVDFDEEENDLVMTFDYNEYFWKKLREEGHPGVDEFEIIDNFIKDWGRKLATEDYSGDYDTKLTTENDEMNQTTGSGEFKIYK